MTLRNRLLLIWIAITLAVAGTNAFRVIASAVEEDAAAAAAAAADQDAPASLAPPKREAELVGKLTVAMHLLRAFGPVGGDAQILLNAEPLNAATSPPSHRIGYAVLVGEVSGWEAGAELAREFEREAADDAARAFAARASAAMEARAADPAAVPPTDACVELEESLGYFGRVLCGSGEDEAWRAMFGFAGIIAWYGLAAVVGFAALLWILILLFGSSRSGRMRPSDSAADTVLLGETFVVWLVLFFALNLGGAVLVEAVVDGFGAVPRETGTTLGLAVSFVAFFLSLLALGYPILRGMRASELMRLCGLHRGAGCLRELMAGVACYFSAVPLLLGGFLVFFVLSWLSTQFMGESPAPSHPATDLIAGASGLQLVLLFAVASIAAPIVEEIAFRGVLYGHMRGAVTPRIRWLSILASAVVSSAIFAAVHPQGLLFTPVLGGLATGFALSRELRGSLIAPMAAHAISNAVTLSIGISLMS